MPYLHGANGKIEVEPSFTNNRPGEIYFSLVITSKADKGSEGCLYMTIDQAKSFATELDKAIEIALGRLPKIKELEMKELKLTAEFLKDLSGYFGRAGREVVEKHYPEVFTQELTPGYYRDREGVLWVLFDDNKYWRLVSKEGYKLCSDNTNLFRSDVEQLAELRQILSGMTRVVV